MTAPDPDRSAADRFVSGLKSRPADGDDRPPGRFARFVSTARPYLVGVSLAVALIPVVFTAAVLVMLSTLEPIELDLFDGTEIGAGAFDIEPALRAAVRPAPPPPDGGTVAQPEALGAAMSAAVRAGDADAAAALLDRGSLLRGMFGEAYEAELTGTPPPAAGGSLDLSTELPPGAVLVHMFEASLLNGLFEAAAEPGAAFRDDGVREVDGRPAAAVSFLTNLSPDRPRVSALLIPGPDGRVAAIYLEADAAVLPALPATGPVGGYFADLLRSALIQIAAGEVR